MAEIVLTEKKGSPPEVEWDIYRADTFTKVIRFKDKNEDPRDITDSEFEFEVRVSPYQNTGDPLIKATQFIKGQSSVAQDDGIANDEVLIKIDEDETDVVAGKWVADFRETDGSGDRKTRFKVIANVNEDVSRK